jgi:O-6-methylguanine DNA methyltransferase
LKSAQGGFNQQVYDLTSQIPRGKVTTYGLIAKQLGRPKASRAVGRILGKNPHPIVVPCHRVVKSDGTMGGYSGGEGVKTKIALLTKEGVEIRDGKVDLDRFVFRKFGLEK